MLKVNLGNLVYVPSNVLATSKNKAGSALNKAQIKLTTKTYDKN